MTGLHRDSSPHILLIPPFAESAKAGAPDHCWGRVGVRTGHVGNTSKLWDLQGENVQGRNPGGQPRRHICARDDGSQNDPQQCFENAG
jgi:hypothetical protein